MGWVRRKQCAFYGVIMGLVTFIACDAQANNISKNKNYSSEAASPDNGAIGNLTKTMVPEAAGLNSEKPNLNVKKLRYGRLPDSPVVSAKSHASSSAVTAKPLAQKGDSQKGDSRKILITNVSEEDMRRELNIGDTNQNNGVRTKDVASWQKIGSPYQVNNTWYIPAHEADYDEEGVATWYGSDFQGKITADGETFDMNLVTVAHPTLPIPSLVEITNLENGRSIIARVNDRGPFASNRLVDVSARGAELLGFKDKGSAKVRVRYVGQAQPIANPQPKSQFVLNIPHVPQQMADSPAEPNQKLAQKSDKSGNYIQIGAFSNLGNAQRAAKQNSGRGKSVITSPEENGSNLFKVMLIPDNNEAMPNDITANNAGIVSVASR